MFKIVSKRLLSMELIKTTELLKIIENMWSRFCERKIYTLKLTKVMLSWIKQKFDEGIQQLIDDGPYELTTSNLLTRTVEAAKKMIRKVVLTMNLSGYCGGPN
jgi:hypothetical protein